MQCEELQDFLDRRSLRTVPASIEGKLFWTTREDAERFARLLLARCGIGPSWVVEVRVRPAVLQRLAPLTIDGRPARFVDEKDLDWFNGVVMDLVVPSFEQYGGSGG